MLEGPWFSSSPSARWVKTTAGCHDIVIIEEPGDGLPLQSQVRRGNCELYMTWERELGDSFIARKSFSASKGFARTRRPHRMSLQSGNNLGCQYHSTACGQACIKGLLYVAPLLLRCSFRGASPFRRVRGQHGWGLLPKTDSFALTTRLDTRHCGGRRGIEVSCKRFRPRLRTEHPGRTYTLEISSTAGRR